MVYIPGSARQQGRWIINLGLAGCVWLTTHQTCQRPADSHRAIPRLRVQLPGMPHIKGTELDLGCLHILVPKKISIPRIVRARESALDHRDMVHTTSSKFTRAQTLTFPTFLLKEWMQEPPCFACWNKAPLFLSGRLYIEVLTPATPSQYQALQDRSQPDVNYRWGHKAIQTMCIFVLYPIAAVYSHLWNTTFLLWEASGQRKAVLNQSGWFRFSSLQRWR